MGSPTISRLVSPLPAALSGPRLRVCESFSSFESMHASSRDFPVSCFFPPFLSRPFPLSLSSLLTLSPPESLSSPMSIRLNLSSHFLSSFSLFLIGTYLSSLQAFVVGLPLSLVSVFLFESSFSFSAGISLHRGNRKGSWWPTTAPEFLRERRSGLWKSRRERANGQEGNRTAERERESEFL
ncbi:hypothetical protein TGVAND_229660 [Toxoplasma gondii VAND]|uniref:Uncharacterized protein n=1 Tax=Toxoplasma gondii VAND TaxID=933077 RepID=A0A086PRT4_TOXGO|nr:hypothetical protein TGVAND_229660 [Toxoplasma gondii VAND]